MKKDDMENYYEEDFEILTPPIVIDEEDTITTSLSLHSVNSQEKLKTPKKPSFIFSIRSQSANASRKPKNITQPTATEKLLKDINLALDYKTKKANDFLKEGKNLRFLIRKMNEDFKNYIEKNKQDLMGIVKKKNDVNVDRFLLDKEKWNNKTILLNLKKEEDKLKEFYKRLSQKNYEKNLEVLINTKKEEIKNLRRENANLKKTTQNQSKIMSNPKLLFHPKKKTRELEEIIYNTENLNKELSEKINLKEEKLKILNEKEANMNEKFEKIEKIAAFYKIDEENEKEELKQKFAIVQRLVEQKEKIISFYSKHNYRNEIKNLKGELRNLDRKVDKIVGEVILQEIEIKSKTREEPLNVEGNSFQEYFIELKNEEMLKLGLKIDNMKSIQKKNISDVSRTQELQFISTESKAEEKHLNEFDKKEEVNINEVNRESMIEAKNSKSNNQAEVIKLDNLKKFKESLDKSQINQPLNFEYNLNGSPSEKTTENQKNNDIKLKEEQPPIIKIKDEQEKQIFSLEKIDQFFPIEESPLITTSERPTDQNLDETKKEEIKISSKKSIKNDSTPKTTASQKIEEPNLLDLDFTPLKIESSNKSNFNFANNMGPNSLKEPRFFNFSRSKKNSDSFHSKLSDINNEINAISSDKKEVNFFKEKENNEEIAGNSRRKKKMISNLDSRGNTDTNRSNFMENSYIDRKIDKSLTDVDKISEVKKKELSHENHFYVKNQNNEQIIGQKNFLNIFEEQNESESKTKIFATKPDPNPEKSILNKRLKEFKKDENDQNLFQISNEGSNFLYKSGVNEDRNGNLERKYEGLDSMNNSQKKRREIKLFEDDEEHFIKEKEIKLDDEWGRMNRKENKQNVINNSNKEDNFNFFSDFNL